MREILFRAKREDNGEWVYGYYVRMPDAAGSVHRMYVPAENPDESNHVFYIDPQTVDRYTGLTDKNGAKIFEKDIVEADFGIAGMNKLVVEFETGAFYLCHNARLMYLLRNWHDYVEVVGNIYDNPELLGGDGNERD